MSPKVLIVIDHLDAGGAPVAVCNLIKGLDGLGASVTLIVLSGKVRHALPSDVKIVMVGYVGSGFFGKIKRYSRHASLFDEAVRSNGLEDADLVLTHLHVSHQIVSRSVFSDRAWYCLHSDPGSEYLGNKKGLSKKIKHCKVLRLYGGKKIVGVSRGVVDSLLGLGVRPMEAVPIMNAVDVGGIRELSKKSVDDVAGDFLLFVGRLSNRSKRIDRLLEGYKESGVLLPLLIVGDGPDKSFVERCVNKLDLSGKVRLLGRRDNPFPYMKQAKALLLSSDYEGFALVLAEALACGTPVVSTDCPSGPSEIMVNELSEFLVPLDSVSDYAAAIRRVVVSPPEISHDMLERFSPLTVAGEYLALCESDPSQLDVLRQRLTTPQTAESHSR